MKEGMEKMTIIDDVKFNQEFMFEAKVDVSITANNALLFIAYTQSGRFSIFEDNKHTAFYQGMTQLLVGGEQKTFYIRAKARRLVGNQYGDKAQFVKDKLTGEPLVELIPAPDLVDIESLRREVTTELNKLSQSNERYAAFVRFALSKTINPQNQSFIHVPAGVKGGYSFKGGLLAHTVRLLKRLEHEMYLNQNPLFGLAYVDSVNYDLLKLCVFIHEIGKCQAYTLSASGTPEKTMKGKINHHLYWTLWEVHRLLEMYNAHDSSNELELTENEKLLILDVVSSAHYVEGRDGIASPKTKEAHLFNKLECMDHKQAEIEMAEHENQGRHGFVKLMGGEELLVGQFIPEVNPNLQNQINNQSMASEAHQSPVMAQQPQYVEQVPVSGQVQLGQTMPTNVSPVMSCPTPQQTGVGNGCPSMPVMNKEQVPGPGVMNEPQSLKQQNEDISYQSVRHDLSGGEVSHHVFTSQQQWYNHAAMMGA